MTTFPIVLYPKAITAALDRKPEIVQFTEPKPLLTATRPKRFSLTLLSIEALATVVLTTISWWWLVVGILVIGATLSLSTMSYQGRLRNYRVDVNQYETQLAQWHQTKASIEAEARLRNSPDYLKNFYLQALQSALQNVSTPDCENPDARIGKHERKLEPYLRQYFGNKIHTKKALSIRNFDHPYTPDFSYIDPVHNLHMDIEVDEPYTVKGSRIKPIHFVGKDEDRNQFFLERNWIVVRFAEEQVVRSPEGCCKVIATVLAKLLRDDRILEPFAAIPDLVPIPQWTESEALVMGQNQTRRRLQP